MIKVGQACTTGFLDKWITKISHNATRHLHLLCYLLPAQILSLYVFVILSSMIIQCRKILHCNDKLLFIVDHLLDVGSMFQVGDFWELAKHVLDEVITRPWLLNSQSEQSSHPLGVEHFSTLEIHRSMLFSIAEVVKSRKNLAQITIAAAMIALASGVYTGHYDDCTHYYSLQSTVVAWTVAEFCSCFLYFLWFLRWNRRLQIHKHW